MQPVYDPLKLGGLLQESAQYGKESTRVIELDNGTYYIETYGCQMNEHDSEKMSALLEETGLIEADSPERAGVVVINTCSIREKAEHKVYSALGRLRSLKAKNPDMVTVVVGQDDALDIVVRQAQVDEGLPDGIGAPLDAGVDDGGVVAAGNNVGRHEPEVGSAPT